MTSLRLAHTEVANTRYEATRYYVAGNVLDFLLIRLKHGSILEWVGTRSTYMVLAFDSSICQVGQVCSGACIVQLF